MKLKHQKNKGMNSIKIAVLVAFLQPFVGNAQQGGTPALKDDKNGLVIDLTGGGATTIEKGVKLMDDPKFVDTLKVNFEVEYVSINKKVETKFPITPINPPKLLVIEPLDKLYKANVKLGVNDFLTPPYFNFTYATDRNKEYNAGLSLNHFSSQQKIKGVDKARYSESNVSVYGKKFSDKNTIYGNLDYDYNTFRNYGFPTAYFTVPEKDVKNQYSLLSGKVGINNNWEDSEKINHVFELGYNNLFARYQVKEHLLNFSAAFNGHYLPNGGLWDSLKLNDGIWNAKLNLSYLNTADTAQKIGSTLVDLTPTFTFKHQKLNLTAGPAIYFLTNDARALKIYPFLNLDFTLAKDILMVYGKWSGRYERNHYLTYFQSNPFIGANLPQTNSNVRYDLVAGLKGAINAKSTFNFGVKHQKVDDFVLFVNDTNTVELRKYNIITDDVVHTQVFGELIFENKKIKAGAKGQYNMYQVLNNEAYNLPAVYLEVYGRYNIQDKFKIGTDLFYYGEQVALVANLPSTPPITRLLKPIFDFNLSLDYKYSERVGGFIKVNNILSTKHQRWNQYPNYGINFMLGFSYSF